MNNDTWDKFCDDPDVMELLEQLNSGLIHPIEYAYKITALFCQYARRN